VYDVNSIMELYPAIDLMDGACVRLYKGDFDTSKIYETDPVSTATRFQNEGAKTLHLVDLDGAKDPDSRQTKLIQNIIQETGLNVQTGGGVRNKGDVDTLLNAGAQRVVIGSLAVTKPDLVLDILDTYGTDTICLALDLLTKDGHFLVATSGWQGESAYTFDDIISRYVPAGLKHILCTDISKDGTLQGPNLELYTEMTQRYPNISIQASGGVGCLEDLMKLKPTGVSAVIAGKAIYEEKFSVKQGIEAC
jgi:phosphoribosylformimino-5-aminoimidazole carboxamide ribotide isomerase